MFEPFRAAPSGAKIANVLILLFLFLSWVSTMVTFGSVLHRMSEYYDGSASSITLDFYWYDDTMDGTAASDCHVWQVHTQPTTDVTVCWLLSVYGLAGTTGPSTYRMGRAAQTASMTNTVSEAAHTHTTASLFYASLLSTHSSLHPPSLTASFCNVLVCL